MATCPHCSTSSRTEPDALWVENAPEYGPQWQAKRLGTWSLSGAQMKWPIQPLLRLRCRCGWSILGVLAEDQSFLGNPDTQQFPTSTGNTNDHA